MSKHDQKEFTLSGPWRRIALVPSNKVNDTPPRKGVTIGTDGREHTQKRPRPSWNRGRGELVQAL